MWDDITVNQILAALDREEAEKALYLEFPDDDPDTEREYQEWLDKQDYLAGYPLQNGEDDF